MEVLVASPVKDFRFDSACSSPYISAPSSPRGFGRDFFFSAPTSPTRASAIYREFSLSLDNGDCGDSSSVPFEWGEKPGTPKSNEADDFAFEFSGPLDQRTSLSAEDLFDGGKIKPLKPPTRLQVDEWVNQKSPVSSPRSSRIEQGRKVVREAFSPRKKKDSDPFTAAIEPEQERGRERVSNIYSSSNSSRRGSRSLSPFRVSKFAWEEEQKQSTKASPSNSKPPSASKGYRKWKLKDFLLFRSASEGRATEKDPLRKLYSAFSKKNEDVKNSSFRSIDSNASTSSGSRRSKGRVSAHELHYTANRAVSEELKKKTFLPYKRGLLGCLAFNPTANGLARGLNSVNRRSTD